MAAIFDKEPGDTVEFFVPWTRWLRTGDPIDTSDVTIEPINQAGAVDAVTIPAATINAGADGVTIWTTGGALDGRYEVTNTVTTDAGRVGVRRFLIHCTKMYTEKGA